MNREQEMVSIACKAIDDKKALDIKVIDIREVCDRGLFCDYKRKQSEPGAGNCR